MASHFTKMFLGNRHSGCQLFLAQNIRPITAYDRGFPNDITCREFYVFVVHL